MQTNILVIDNGGNTIKAGLSTNDSPTVIMANTTARIKKSLHELVGDETVTSITDHSQLMYNRPIEKGYVVDWDIQSKIWNQLMNTSHLNIDPHECNLFVSQPLFNMDELMKATLQVAFEHFQFNGFYSSPAPIWSFEQHQSNLPLDNISRHTNTGLIVESGFSFTHVVPIVDGHVMIDAVRRINVGGKLLTNLLKENLSFRQVNVQDCTYLVNIIKEKYSYLSLDVFHDLDESRKFPKKYRKMYVLPDYVTSSTGYELQEDQKVAPGTQLISLINERFMVPEALFAPSDIGIRQAGLAETVGNCLKSFAPGVRDLLSNNIVLSGGNTCIPQFRQHTQDIMQYIDEGKPVCIYDMKDPILDTWRGGSLLARKDGFEHMIVTREMYEENGPYRLLRSAFQSI